MIVLLLFLSAFALLAFGLYSSVMVRALRDFSRHELEKLCERQGRQKLLGEILRWHESVDEVAENVNVFSIVCSAALATTAAVFALLGQLTPAHGLAIVLAIGAAVLITNVWIAQPLAKLYATPLVFRSWRFWRVASRILAPVVMASRLAGALVFRLSGRKPLAATEESLEDEIRTIVTEGHREGLLEEDAREMIESVIELSDVTVGEVMTPRTDMVSLHVSETLDHAAEFFVEAGHSRIPVYDKNHDEIVGILYIKDLLAEIIRPADERPKDIAGLARPPVYVPESKPVDDLLQEFQRQRNHMAIVLDEFGGVAGLVTIEDILEEIVGEIVDEHDEEEVEEIRRVGEGTVEVPGWVRVEDINERLRLNIAGDTDFETIGGFVFSELGHVPQVGEQLLWKNLRITVLAVEHRRIELLRIEAQSETPSEQVPG